MLNRFLSLLSVCCLSVWFGLAMLTAPVMAAPAFTIERGSFDREDRVLDLRPQLEYVVMPVSAVDPERAWQLDSTSFKPMQAGQRLQIPQGYMLLARVELKVKQVRDPDYLQFPSARLDKVHLWARAVGQPWQQGEGGDRVAMSQWPFAGPFPSFELPDGNERLQLVMAIEHRGSLNLPIEWSPDHVFRAQRLAHAFTFGAIAGLAAALALICALATALFRRIEFAGLCAYTLLTGLSLSASNGYAAIYLWPELPAWNDPSKGLLGMLLVALLLPLVAHVLRLDVHRPAWWTASWRWALAGVCYALLQAAVLPPEWRTVANLLYVLATLAFAVALALRGVLRADAMSRLTLAAIVMITVGTVLGYGDQFDMVNELSLHLANAACRLGFVVLIFCVAVQRHRYGRDVLSRLMAGDNRDPLTGMHNRAGLKQELTRAALMVDAADTVETGVLLCELQNMNSLRADFGDEVCDRILLRFAQVLADGMRGDAALFARLAYGRFAAVVLRGADRDNLQDTATRILSRMLSQSDLPDAVRGMKLRIAMVLVPLSDLQIDIFEARMGQKFVREDDPRNIRWLESSRTGVSVK